MSLLIRTGCEMLSSSMRASAVAGEERWAASIIVMKRPIESFFIIDSQSFKELASPIPAPVVSTVHQ